MSHASDGCCAPPNVNPEVDELFENDEGEQEADIDYENLLTVSLRDRPLDEVEQDQAKKVVFYCKQCRSLITTKRKKGKKLKFICNECGSSEVYYGSELGIRGFFNV